MNLVAKVLLSLLLATVTSVLMAGIFNLLFAMLYSFDLHHPLGRVALGLGVASFFASFYFYFKLFSGKYTVQR